MHQLLSLNGLVTTLQRVNAYRQSPSMQSNENNLHEIEGVLEALFKPSTRLAVYGSLAPGKSNHHVIGNLAGGWLEGYITGKFYDRGWGSNEGYPGIIWIPGEARVNVQLFVSDQLPDHWPRLDQFEGAEYQRSLVPVFDDHGLLSVANIYEICG